MRSSTLQSTLLYEEARMTRALAEVLQGQEMVVEVA